MENVDENLDLYGGLIKDLSNSIDVNNINKLGANCQKRIEFFTGEVTEKINDESAIESHIDIPKIINDINDFNSALNGKNSLFNLFQSKKINLEKIKSKYKTIDENLSSTIEMLEEEKYNLNNDVLLMEEFYKTNKDNVREMNLFIKAGEKKLKEINDNLSRIDSMVLSENSFQENEDISYIKSLSYRLEKRIYNLKLTLNICIQMSSIMKFIQNNKQDLIDKIDTILFYTIPLWKNQMLISMGLNSSTASLNLCQEIESISNEIFVENTSMLRNESINIANSTENSHISITSIREGNKNLIDAFSEVASIRQRGRLTRKSNEGELKQMEKNLAESLSRQY